jgi:hypothetical protein
LAPRRKSWNDGNEGTSCASAYRNRLLGGRARDAGAREVLVLDAVAARERQRRGPRRRRDGGVLRREALAVLAPGRVEHDDRRGRLADDRAPAVAVHLLDAAGGPAQGTPPTPDRNRNVDYFHSTFVDLVLGGLLGIRGALEDRLVIAPLTQSYFAVDNLKYHGRDVAITFDPDGGTVYGCPGLCAYVDGTLVASNASAPLNLTLV